MKRRTLAIGTLVLLTAVAASSAEARDLVEAAQSAQTVLNRIGVAAISIGITVGGILYAVGASQIGRMILISGVVGACAVLGAPALINFIGRIFGAAL
jgi:hypothetical protein